VGLAVGFGLPNLLPFLGDDGRNGWLSCLLSWDPLVVSVSASSGVGGINTPKLVINLFNNLIFQTINQYKN
jgi:hypothetical protein